MWHFNLIKGPDTRCNIACNIACNGVDTRCNCCVKCCRSRTCFYSCNIARNIARNVASCVRSLKHTGLCRNILLSWLPRPRLFKLLCCKTFANEKDISAKFTGGTHLLRNQDDRAAWRSICLHKRLRICSSGQYICSVCICSFSIAFME